MSDTVEIGAARVRLIVDAADFDPIIAQGKSAIIGFGQVAQQAYDRTEKGTRRAADALLDYVNSLGRADTTMDKYIRTASRMGVEKPVLDAAIAAWARHNDEVEQSATALADNEAAVKRSQAAYKELMSTQAQQAAATRAAASAAAQDRFENLGAARAAASQGDINSLVAPGLGRDTDSVTRQMAAEEVFAEIVAKQNLELEQQLELTKLIAQGRIDSNQQQAQRSVNELVAPGLNSNTVALEERRNAARAAFLPFLEEEIKLENEAASLSQKQQAFIQQLENTAATAGKTYYEMLQLRQAELGLGEAYTPLIQKIRSQNETMGAGTLSAKQYEFALRGLPAQFTDIVVSLQGGQRPLTVLLQQGGQIKDMFGGVGNALKVVGKEALGVLTNPWLLLATAVAGLGVAAYEAQSRMTGLAIATAKGNQVAGSASGLSTLAESLAKISGTSIGNADKAITSLASAGKLTGTNLAEAAQATARWATITGESVDDVAGKFNELATDPLAAVLNGTLRVTDAQYAQLEAFDRTGQKAKEVALAIKLYQDQVNDNSDSVLKNLSDGEKGWIALKDAITGAVHSLGEWTKESAGAVFNRLKKPNSVGTPGEGMAESLGEYYSGSSAPGEAAGAATVAATQAAIAAAQDKTVKLTPLQTAANDKLQKSYDELGTKTQKFNTELIKLQSTLKEASPKKLSDLGIKIDGDSFSGAGYQKLYEGLRLKIFGQNAGGDPTRPIKEWEKTALDSLKNVQQAQDYLYADRDTTIETYYAKSQALVKAEEAVQLESITEQIAALKGRANSEAQIAQLTQEKQTVEQQYAEKKAKLDRDELLSIRAREQEYRNYTQTLADANIQLARQGEQAARGVGLGSREAALADAQDNARFAEGTQERNIQQRADDHQIDQVEADREKAAAVAALSTQLTILQGNYANLSTAEASWLNGSKKAFQDWSEDVANVAKQAQQLTTTVITDLQSEFLQLIQTGHLSFKKLLTDIVTQIETAGIQYALKQAFNFGINGVNGGSSASGDYGTNFGGALTSIGAFLFSAKGNAFGGESGLTAYRNSIVAQPTIFPFSKGGMPNVGVMGEKSGSPGEAIMPLTRTSGGDLGVKVTGQQPQRTFNNTQYFVVPGAVDRRTQSQLAIKQGSAASRAARRA